MENIEKVMITNIIEKSHVTFGFAKIASNGEQAYMGPQIFQHNDLRIGDTVFCDIGDNDPRFSDRGCKKRVVFVYDESGPFSHLLPQAAAQPVVEAAPVVAVPDFEVKITSQMIRDYIERVLSEEGFFFTTAQIVDFVNDEFPTANWTAQKAGPYLEQMHKASQIAQISMLTNPNHSKKSKVAWCGSKHWQSLWADAMYEFGSKYDEE